MKLRPKVLFIGSGRLGLPSLAKIAGSEEIDFLGAVTQEDKPAGRKLHLTPTPVGEFARLHGIPLKKIKCVNAPDFLSEAGALNPDFIFLASYGQILKSEILSLPKVEPLNVHGSLLPKHRGAAPVQAAILAGDEEAGISFMRMEKGLDTGPVFAKFAVGISCDDTAHSLEDKLANLAGEHAVDTVLRIFSGELKAVPQDDSAASYARKIEKSQGAIDWGEDAEVIERKIRAYHPWPGAFSEFEIFGRKYRLKIISAALAGPLDLPPGGFHLSKQAFTVACGRGSLALKIVHPDGRKEMPVADFIHGFHRHLG